VKKSYQELNDHILAACLEDDRRCVHGQKKTIGEDWEEERVHLLALPGRDFQCCVTRSVAVNPYSQTNTRFQWIQHTGSGYDSYQQPELAASLYELPVPSSRNYTLQKLICQRPRSLTNKFGVLELAPAFDGASKLAHSTG